MDPTLNQYSTLVTLIEGTSWYALPLLMGFLIPLLYALVGKLMPPNPTATVPSGSEPALNTNLQEASLEKPAATSIVSQLLASTKAFISLPPIPKWVGWLSMVLLFWGVFSVKFGIQNRERIRNNGLRIKNYCLDQNYYRVEVKFLQDNLNLTLPEVEEVVAFYPSEMLFTQYTEDFSVHSDTMLGKIQKTTYRIFRPERKTLLLCEPKLVEAITLKSSNILDGYLSKSNAGFHDLDDLFNQNAFFTYQVCYKLLDKYPTRYALAVVGGRSGIVKVKA